MAAAGIRWGDQGWVSIVGFGSLLSRNSSLFTFPDLQNFRQARLRGFRRVFAHVAPGFLQRCAPSPLAMVAGTATARPLPSDHSLRSCTQAAQTRCWTATQTHNVRETKHRWPYNPTTTTKGGAAVVCGAFAVLPERMPRSL